MDACNTVVDNTIVAAHAPVVKYIPVNEHFAVVKSMPCKHGKYLN